MEEAPITTVLVLTEEQTAMLIAALTHYALYIKRQPPDIQTLLPQVEELQRSLVEEARARTIPYVDAQAIAMLSQMNHAKRIAGTDKRSEAYRQAQALHSYAQSWLMAHTIPLHLSADAWHFGREEP